MHPSPSVVSSSAFGFALVVLVACTAIEGHSNPTHPSDVSTAVSLVSPENPEPPVARFTHSCVGLFCLFDASASTGEVAIVQYRWSWGSGTGLTRTAPTAKVLFPSPGTYNVVLEVVDARGLSSSTAQADTVSAEPPGMTKLGEQAFDCVGPLTCSTEWYASLGYPDGAKAVLDSTAPRSPPGVAQQDFISVLPGGSSPASIGLALTSERQKKTLYFSIWMKLSPNFQGHPTSTNKLVHFYVSGSNRIYMMARGSGDGPLIPSFGLQGLAAPYNHINEAGIAASDRSANLVPNLNNVAIVRGRWHRYEVVLVANTAGVADGSAEMWLDGTKVMKYTGIMFAEAGANARWEEVNWSPTWGGGGGVISVPFFSQVDHVYISGK